MRTSVGTIISVLIVLLGVGMFGAGSFGQREIRDSLAQERINGTPDMKPAGHPDAGVDCTVAGEPIDTGGEARCFARYMRVHALEATGGQVYAKMPRFVDKDGLPTNDEGVAATDPKTGRPAENAARDIWVTQTALSGALNMAFFAESVARFSMAVGASLVLVGLVLLALVRRGSVPAAATGPRPASGAIVSGAARSAPRSATRTPSRRRPRRG